MVVMVNIYAQNTSRWVIREVSLLLLALQTRPPCCDCQQLFDADYTKPKAPFESRFARIRDR